MGVRLMPSSVFVFDEIEVDKNRLFHMTDRELCYEPHIKTCEPGDETQFSSLLLHHRRYTGSFHMTMSANRFAVGHVSICPLHNPSWEEVPIMVGALQSSHVGLNLKWPSANQVVK